MNRGAQIRYFAKKVEECPKLLLNQQVNRLRHCEEKHFSLEVCHCNEARQFCEHKQAAKVCIDAHYLSIR